MEEILKKQQQRFREAKNFSAQSEAVWEMILICQNRPFHTVRNCEFRYTVRGHEIKISRKEKTITRADGGCRSAKGTETGDGLRSQAAGVFGASYLYPLFLYFEIS